MRNLLSATPRPRVLSLLVVTVVMACACGLFAVTASGRVSWASVVAPALARLASPPVGDDDPYTAVPDLQIKGSTDSEYMGVGIHDDLTDQTKTLTVAPAATAVFHIKLANDGTPYSFNVQGMPGSDNWIVHYFSALTGGTDITAAVVAGTYDFGHLNGGESVEFRITVTPPANATGSREFQIMASTSMGNPDAVSAKVQIGGGPTSEYKPDMQIQSVGETAFTGDGVYNLDGANQAKTQTVAQNATATYKLRAQNDGNAADSFAITAPVAAAGWTVQYFDAVTNGNDVTAQVTGAGWNTGNLAAGAAKEFRVLVTPTTAAANSSYDALVTATSAADATKKDAVKTTTTVTGGGTNTYQPDLAIRTAAETNFTGDDVLNLDGANQTKSQSVAQNVTATYIIRLKNLGNQLGSFSVQAPAPTAGWTMRCYDAVTGGTEITSLTTTGWGIGNVPANGGTFTFRIEVTPTTAAAGTSLSELLSVKSNFDNAQRDAVKMVTTVAGNTPAAYQPDAMIRTAADTGFTGDGVLNADGANQTKTLSVAQNATASYVVRLKNTGTQGDSLKVTAFPATTGWTLRFFDSAIGGTDITSAVTLNNGWTSNALAAGASTDIRLEVTPTTATAGASLNELITATSVGDATKKDAVKAVTTVSGGTPTPSFTTILVSCDSNEVQGNNSSIHSCITSGGRYVVFDSMADNLVPGDTNGKPDVFIRDVIAGTTERVSIANDGSQGNGPSGGFFTSGSISFVSVGVIGFSVSNDGRYVVFQSGATNLVANDTNGKYDIFIRDRLSGTTKRINTSLTGGETNNDCVDPFMSPDGRYVVYQTMATNISSIDTSIMLKIILYDAVNDTTELVSVNSAGMPANIHCHNPSLSADGRYIAYYSYASNLVAGVSGPIRHVYVYDRVTHQVTMADVSNSGEYANDGVEIREVQISSNGQYVVFDSTATNLVVNDTNGRSDIFLHNMINGTTSIVDVSSDGTVDNGGQYMISGIGMNQDGRYVSFNSGGSNLVPDDTNNGLDAFVRDTQIAQTERVSLSETGQQISATILYCTALSPDGRYVTFGSKYANNVTSNANNGEAHIYLHDRQGGTPTPTYQPDLAIRTAAETNYIGGGVYNLDAAGQAKFQSVDILLPAVYNLRVQNTATGTDTITVTGPAGDANWTVRYYDAQTGGNEITAQVTGAGWVLADLAAAATRDFRVEVVPQVTATGSKEVLVTATSTGDATKKDTAKGVTSITSVVVGFQPDLLIRNSTDANFIGDGVINTTGVNQTKAQSTAVGVTVNYIIRVKNGATNTDTFVLTNEFNADGGNWQTEYFDIANNTTINGGLFLEGGWSTGILQPGETRDLRVTVTALSGSNVGDSDELLMTATSVGNASKKDVVKAVTTVGNGPTPTAYKPDALIRNSGETTSVGNDIYNSDGAGQEKAQTIIAGMTGIYIITVQNDGATADVFRVTESQGSAGWNVKYYDSATGGNDITAAVTGTSGWSTAQLAAGATKEIRLEVTPSPELTNMAPKTILVTVTSNGDATKLDVVKAVTTPVPGSTEQYQPDLLIRAATDAAYLGGYVYNTTGEYQRRELGVRAGVTAVFMMKLRNNSLHDDSFLLNAPAGATGWTVKYLTSSGADITAALSGSGWTVGPIAAGGEVVLKVEVTPAAGLALGARRQVFVLATSQHLSSKKDLVLADTLVVNQRPDLQLRAAGETSFGGNDIYNTNGAGQARTLTVMPGATTEFTLRVQNDGTSDDTFRINGWNADAGWTVSYRDANGVDRTAQIVKSGWVMPALAPGASALLTLRVSPLAAAVPGTSKTVLVTVTSLGDPTKTDVVRAVTILNKWQPDLHIRTSFEPAYTGDNLYAPTGAGQVKGLSINTGNFAAYLVRVQNDGQTADTFRVTGTGGNSAWSVYYRDAATNVNLTAAVTAGGWVTAPLAPGAMRTLLVQVMPRAGVPGGMVYPLQLSAVSIGGAASKDMVRLNTTAVDGQLAGPWPTFRRDLRRAGRSFAKGPDTAAQRWAYAAGGPLWSSPVVGIDGTVYTGSNDRKVHAVNPDGTVKWTYTTGGIVASTPALAVDGAVYAGAEDGKLYAINPNGTLRWAFPTGAGIFSSPALCPDGTIVVGSKNGMLFAINPNGTQKWVFTTGAAIYATPAVGADGTVYIGSYDGKLYAVKPDGSQQWAYTVGSRIYSSPAVGANGVIYVGADDGALYAISPTGTFEWKLNTGGLLRSSPAIGSDGTIYIGAENKRLYAVKPDGTVKWSYLTFGYVDSSPALDASGTVYVGSDDGKLYAITAGGQLKWSFTTGAAISASPAIGGDGTVYIGSTNGTLFAVGPGAGPVALQPDLWLRTAAEADYTGNDIISGDGGTQTKQQYIAIGGSTVTLFRVQNDGNTPDDFLITGLPGGSGWTVRYYDAAHADITAAITGNGWHTGTLAPEASAICYVRVTATMPTTATQSLVITAQSVSDSQKKDVARAVTTVTGYQPDLWLRTVDDTGYLGDDIYSNDGANQVKGKIVPVSTPATFVLRIQNDGSTSETYTLVGTGGGSGWSVRYFDAANVDITALMMAGTWSTGALDGGASKGFYLKVIPDTGVSTGAAFTLQVKARSSLNKYDAVRCVVTKQ